MSFSVTNNTATLIEERLYDSFEAIFLDMGWSGENEVPIIFSKENGLEPKNTYCAISILNRSRTGRTDHSTFLQRDTDEMWWTQHYQLYLQLSFIGKDAANVAWAFDECLPESRVYLETLQRNSLGWLTKSDLRRMPQPRETRWVEAYNIDINLSFALQYRQVMDWIEFITIGGIPIRIYPDNFEIRTVEEAIERTIDSGAVREVYNH